jgi:multiple sugar transport system permease protein
MSEAADRRGTTAGDIAAWAFLVLVGVVFLVPLVWILSTSLKTPGEIFNTPTTMLPVQPTFQNYAEILASSFPSYLVNSLIAATGATFTGLLFCVPAAFGFAKYGYRASTGFFYVAAGTRIFPPIALILPFFLQFRLLGLIDTPFGLIVAYIPIVFPLMLWILYGFFRDYPDEILDAARIDGLGPIRTLIRIVVPTSLPALGVATLFGFLVAWNEFLIALTLTRTPAGQTLPVGIASQITQFQTLWGQMMAAAAIYLLPVLAVTLVAQRGLVRGLMTGATKG